MKKLLLLIALCLVFSFPSSAQLQGAERTDSLLKELAVAKEDTGKVKLLNLLARDYLYAYSIDTASNYCHAALALAEKLRFKKGLGDSYNIMGMIYDSQASTDEAIKNYKMSIKIREEIGDKKGLAAAYNNLGIVYANQNNDPEALKLYFLAVKINEEMDNKPWLANNYNNLGLIYSGSGNNSEALKMNFAALKIYEEMGDTPLIAGSLNNIGILYWTQKDYQEGLNVYSKILEMLKGSDNPENLNHPYNNMAGIYADMNNYTEALRCYSMSLKYREEMGDKNLIADIYAGQGVVNFKMKNFDQALIHFNEAKDLYTETGNDWAIAGIYASYGEIDMALKKFASATAYFKTAMEYYAKAGGEPIEYYYIYDDLAKVDSAAGNYQSAFENYKLFVFYRDSTSNKESSNKLIQTQMQYDFDKKDAVAKAEQDQKDAIALEQSKRQRNIRDSSFAGLAGLLLFSLVVVRQRNKVKKEKKRSDELLLNILPSETAEELKATGTAAAKDFDQVTVLFTDFKNFTQASEKMNARELVDEIHYYFSEFDKIISRHNIEKIKTIGDSYMAAGGLPIANKTNSADAVAAALDIQAFMVRMKEERHREGKPFFEIRIGIHTGPVVAGIVGIKKFAYDIWGDTVNIASRMESSGQEGKVNISGSTYDLVKDKFKCSYRGKIQAKHKGEIDMYFVEG